MAWPSGSKAITANVDQGSDKPSLARVDIKQNIDNVNDIIDTFNISSPSDGDLLQYSSSTGVWEQVASSSIGGGGGDYALITFGISKTLSGSFYLYRFTEQFDPNGIVSITNNYELNLDAGNYIFHPVGQGSDAQQNITVFNDTASSTIDLIDFQELGSTTSVKPVNIIGFTLTTTSIIHLRDTDSAGRGNYTINITKF